MNILKHTLAASTETLCRSGIVRYLKPFSYHGLFFTGRTGYRRVKAGIERVEILKIQFFLYGSERFAKSLEVYDFPRPEETDRIRNFRIFDETQNIVVSGPGFLFRSKVFE